MQVYNQALLQSSPQMVSPRSTDRGDFTRSHSVGSAPSMRTTHSDSVEVFSPHSHVSSIACIDEHDLSDLDSRFRSLSTSRQVLQPWFCYARRATTLRASLFELKYPRNVILYDYTIRIETEIGTEDEDLPKHLVTLFENSKGIDRFVQRNALDGAHRLIAMVPRPEGFSVTISVHVGDGKVSHAGESLYIVALVGLKDLKSTDLAQLLFPLRL